MPTRPAALHSRLAGFLVIVPTFLVLAVPALAQPDSFDWRDEAGQDLVAQVKNQLNCGSTYIFGPVAMVESRCMIENFRATGQKHEIDLSEQYIMACRPGFDCGGGHADYTLAFLRDTGAPFEPCYEYVGQDETCPTACVDEPGPLELQTPVQAYVQRIGYWDPTEIMNEILANGPVAARMQVYTDLFSYDEGIYEHTSGDYRGTQIVLIVGWGNRGGTGHWICRNTWGTAWGMDGDFLILRDRYHAGCNFGETILTADVHLPVSATPTAPRPSMLSQNVPNPFNPVTLIRYTPAVDGPAILTVFDLAGQRVARLAEGDHVAGSEYVVHWNGQDDRGREVPSGVYLYRLQSGARREMQRMVLLR